MSKSGRNTRYARQSLFKRIPSRYIMLGLVLAALLGVERISHPPPGQIVESFVVNESAAAGAGQAPKSGPGKPDNQTAAGPASTVANRPKSGTVMFGPPGSAKLVKWRHVQPILDNRADFAKYFPNGEYDGDLGDRAHQQADPPQDHTPRSGSAYDGHPAKRDWIYAQDFGTAKNDGFNLPLFASWLLDEVRAGKYPEVKYIVTRSKANQGRDGGKYYGLFMRESGWKRIPAAADNDPNDSHRTHIHISYMMTTGSIDMEHIHSSIIADYAAWLKAHPGG